MEGLVDVVGYGHEWTVGCRFDGILDIEADQGGGVRGTFNGRAAVRGDLRERARRKRHPEDPDAEEKKSDRSACLHSRRRKLERERW